MRVLNKIKILLISLFILIFSMAVLAACQNNEITLQEISLQGYKTEFACGEEFSVGDLVVTAKYSNATTKTVENYQIDSSKYKKETAGEYTIVCSYAENGVTKSGEYTVQVKETFSVTEIEVEGQNLYFDIGTEFSFGEGIVRKIYSDGLSWELREDDYQIDSSAYQANLAGEYEIAVVCGEYQTKYTVAVMDETYIQSVTVTQQRTKYTLGQDFVFNGTVTISYTNDRPNDVVPASKYVVNADGYKKDELGNYVITVSVGEKSFTYTVKVEEVKSFKFLMIGNSYSDDTAEYMPEIAKDFNFDEVEFGVLYIGGCSLQQHYQNSQTGYKGYEFRYYQNGAWTTKYGNELKSLEYGIKFKDWDFISLQQASGQSGTVNSYGEDLTNLIKYVKNTATNPDMQLVWNMTWAYQNDSKYMKNSKYTDQLNMYRLIVNAVQTKIVNNSEFMAISPAGTAVQNARTSVLGDTLNRDGTHLSYDVGRYIAAMSMFCSITGYSVGDIQYVPKGLDQTRIDIAKESVRNALENKYSVTAFRN